MAFSSRKRSAPSLLPSEITKRTRPWLLSVGIARQRADAGKGAGLVQAAVMAVQQIGVGREQLEHLGEAAGGEVVAAADARALLEMDGVGEPVGGEHLVRDL